MEDSVKAFKGKDRREFLKLGGAVLAAGATPFSALSYASILGVNDRVLVGVIGCGDRMKGSLIPAFQQHAKELCFELVTVSDLWNRRREQGAAYIQKLSGNPIAPCATTTSCTPGGSCHVPRHSKPSLSL